MPVTKHPALKDRHPGKWRDLQRQAFIGDQGGVTSEHLLPVACPLQRPQNVFEVASHGPRVPISPRGQTNLLQLRQARQNVMILRLCVAPVGINRFPSYCERARIVTTASLNDSIEGSEPELLNLSLLGFKRIAFCPKAQFMGCEFLSMAANSRLNECTRKPKRGSAVVKAAQCNMDVRVLGIVMHHGDPLQF